MAYLYPLLLALALPPRCISAAPLPRYRDPSAPIPDRVADLLPRMTPLELAHQLVNKNEGGWGDLPDILAQFNTTGVGSLFIDEVMNKSRPADPALWSTPLAALRARNALQAAFLNASRLAIPVSFCMEGLHSGGWGGTSFPGPPALAASWNATLITAVGRVIALEARSTGVDTALAPVVNMFVDPRFGRYSEGFSPDPHVSAALGAAMVRGLQGDDSPGGPASYLPSFTAAVAAQAKHFAAYGHAAGGLNGGVAELTNRTLFEIYLKPWRAMAAAGLRSLMVAHQTVNDIPCHGNRWLITDVMRREYGFGEGMTISDEMNIPHLGPGGWGVAENLTHSAAVALRAGVDIDLQAGGNASSMAYNSLLEALDEGLITLADLRAAAARVLTLKFAVGLFDAPFAPEAALSNLQAPAHLALALEAARQGLVLAKNDGDLLPFAPSAAAPLRLALIGPFLDCAFADGEGRGGLRDPTPYFCTAREALLGPYAQDNGQFPVPLLPEALAALAAPGLSWTVAQGASATAQAANASLITAAVGAAAAADAAVLLLGDALPTFDEGADRSSLDLTPGQLALLQAVAANTSVPLVLVLLNGKPTTFGPGLGVALLSRVRAILVASRPGQLGAQAIAEVLLGITNPSGKLADAWPLSVGHLGAPGQPMQQLANGEWQLLKSAAATADPDGRRYPSYWDDNRAPAAPLFPLGWGLSFTAFGYRALTVAPGAPLAALPAPLAGRAALRAAATTAVAVATVHVCNAGAVAGTETVLLFSRDPRGGSGGARVVAPYVKRLVGFARLPLAPGECGDAVIPVSADDLAQHATDYAGAGLALGVLPGLYTFSAGPHARADNLTANLRL
jgi:beta-glucosidase